MTINFRRYKALVDFMLIHNFLSDTYTFETLNGGLVPPYFEFGHTHRLFNYHITHHFGIWEDGKQVVGFVCYGMYPGEYPGRVHLHVRKGYERLLPEILNYAEKQMYRVVDGRRQLGVWTTSGQSDLKMLLASRCYKCETTEPCMVFNYEKGFREVILPKGFTINDAQNVDYEKLHACFWQSFEGKNDPENNYDCRIHMWNTPNTQLDLNTVVTAPNGEYAAALGMWLDIKNNYAYLEPLGVSQQYQGKGIGTAILTYAMQKTEERGAKYCFGSKGKFYESLGFEVCGMRELWVKPYELMAEG